MQLAQLEIGLAIKDIYFTLFTSVAEVTDPSNFLVRVK
jgi:hypothetical protein